MTSQNCRSFLAIIIVVFSQASESELIHGRNLMRRDLFSVPSAFDYYNNICREICDTSEIRNTKNDLTLNINPCPKCAGSYDHEQCNHCCQGGASSLKLRWHGCEGTITIPTTSHLNSTTRNFLESCDVEPETVLSKNAAFVDCTCYDSMVGHDGVMPDRCQITHKTGFRYDGDICIVSTNESSEIDLRKPLPNPLILIQTIPHQNVMYGINEDLRSFQQITLIDTSCTSSNKNGLLHPLFPGYGKFSNTCQYQGFIDLRKNGNVQIPKELDHYKGSPPAEMFWFEFADGSSISFQQNEDNENVGKYFDSSFSTCKCKECESRSSANTISEKPSELLSFAPSKSEKRSILPSPSSSPIPLPTQPSGENGKKTFHPSTLFAKPQSIPTLPTEAPSKQASIKSEITQVDLTSESFYASTPSQTPTHTENPTKSHTFHTSPEASSFPSRFEDEDDNITDCIPASYEACNFYAMKNCVHKKEIHFEQSQLEVCLYSAPFENTPTLMQNRIEALENLVISIRNNPPQTLENDNLLKDLGFSQTKVTPEEVNKHLNHHIQNRQSLERILSAIIED